jgi:hypothetical protein
MKYLFTYPHAAPPYDDLISTNKQRTRTDPKCELLDTSVFSEDRYFDIFVESAKQTPADILVQISARNRRSEPASLNVLPTLSFRNTWRIVSNPVDASPWADG